VYHLEGLRVPPLVRVPQFGNQCSMVTKPELWNTAKLSVFKSIFAPILINGHESCLVTERVLSQVQVAEMEFFRRVHGLTLRYKVRKTLNVKPLPPNREISATIVWPCEQNTPDKTGEASPAGYTHGKATRKSSKDQVTWSHLQPLLGPFLVFAWSLLGVCLVPSWCLLGPFLVLSQQNHQRLLKIVTYFDSFWWCCHRHPPQKKSGIQNEWMNIATQQLDNCEPSTFFPFDKC